MANNIKGRNLLLEIFDDGKFKKIGGLNAKSISRDNPTADVTSSSTPDASNETEAAFTGFGTLTIEGSGVVDSRFDDSHVAYKVFSAIANSSDPVANLRFTDSQESWVGNFIISNFSKNADANDMVNFSSSFENEGQVTYT